MSTNRPSSIRTLLVALVVALVGPLLGLSGYLGYRAYATERATAEQRLISIADAASAGVHQFLTDAERLLQGLSMDPHIRSMDPADCAAHFPDIGHQLTAAYSNLGTWTPEGTAVCSLLPPPDSGLDMTGIPGFEEALAADSFFITPVHRGQRSGLWSTALTLPIRADDGTRLGMLSLSVDLVRFEEILVGMNLPEAALVSLTQLGGTVVARSRDSERYVGTIPPTSDARSRDDPTFSVRGSSRALTFDGVDFSWAFVRVPDTDWIVYAGRATEEVFGGVWQQRYHLILLGTLVVLGAFLMVRAVYERVRRPLQALVRGMAMARPDEPAPLPTDGPREIAWVAERFNQAWTARLQAERDRERSDERIRSIVENAVTGICITTMRGQFLEVNQAMVDLLGFKSREDLLATPADAVYATPEGRERHLEEHGDLEVFTGVGVQWRRKDGAILDVRLFGRRLILEGGEVAWEVVVEDVTELTRLQARYAQAQKMEALGRLAGGIAHDFNNLLTVVQGQADLLMEDPALDPGQREQVTDIFQAATHGAALNQQLLAFGRRTASDRRAANLNEIIVGFELMIRRATGEDVRMDFSLDPKLGPILADQSQLEQILLNLVVNAKDAMPSGGALRVATYEELISAEEAATHPGAQEGHHVVLAISDTGAGIPEDVLPHIFEPFYSTKPVPKGTGLGLATVYGIVTDSGGHLRVESRPSGGTTMRVYFPRHESGPEEDQEEEEEKAAPWKGSGVILLVEDEAAVRRLTQRLLERAGYEVMAASDGREAIDMAEAYSGHIDLLVTDVVMPGLRGHQVAETLAATGKIRRAVLVSGYADGLPQAGPAGVDAWTFLAKPFTGATLQDAVKRMLNEA